MLCSRGQVLLLNDDLRSAHRAGMLVHVCMIDFKEIESRIQATILKPSERDIMGMPHQSMGIVRVQEGGKPGHACKGWNATRKRNVSFCWNN